MPFFSSYEVTRSIPLEYGHLIRNHHTRLHPPSHLMPRMKHYGPMNYHRRSWPITVVLKFAYGHARLNIGPNTFIFTTGHCYSFIATLLVYHSHFTMFFYILLQSVVKCDESRFSMVCVSPWSDHLPSLSKGPSHVI